MKTTTRIGLRSWILALRLRNWLLYMRDVTVETVRRHAFLLAVMAAIDFLIIFYFVVDMFIKH